MFLYLLHQALQNENEVASIHVLDVQFLFDRFSIYLLDLSALVAFASRRLQSCYLLFQLGYFLLQAFTVRFSFLYVTHETLIDSGQVFLLGVGLFQILFDLRIFKLRVAEDIQHFGEFFDENQRILLIFLDGLKPLVFENGIEVGFSKQVHFLQSSTNIQRLLRVHEVLLNQQ